VGGKHSILIDEKLNKPYNILLEYLKKKVAPSTIGLDGASKATWSAAHLNNVKIGTELSKIHRQVQGVQIKAMLTKLERRGAAILRKETEQQVDNENKVERFIAEKNKNACVLADIRWKQAIKSAKARDEKLKVYSDAI